MRNRLDVAALLLTFVHLLTAVAAAEPGATHTLSVRQGLRLADGVVVGEGQPADVTFGLIEPRSGGLRPSFNGVTRDMEWKPEQPIDRNTPTLSAAHVIDYLDAPSVAEITTGDLAAKPDTIYLSSKARHWLVMDRADNAYLLHGIAHDTLGDDPASWKLDVTIEKVTLALGEAGKRNPPLPARLLFRTAGLNPKAVWCDLSTGEAKAVAEGLFPSASSDRHVAVMKSDTAWDILDADDEVVATVSMDPPLTDAVLSPDGKMLAGTSLVPTKTQFQDMTIPGPDKTVVRVVDLDGKEIARFENVTNAAWGSGGRLIAAPVEGNGLLSCDLANGQTSALGNIRVAAEQPTLSPDGKSFAYVSHGRAYVLAIDGGTPKSIWKDAEKQRSPVFSPDGNFVALVSGGAVRVIDLRDGNVITPVAKSGATLATDNYARLSWVK